LFHLTAPPALDSSYWQFQIDTGIARGKITDTLDLMIVKGPVNRAADATNCFFPRRVSRITRAKGSPKMPTTVRCGVKPGKRYESLRVFFLMHDSYHVFPIKNKSKTLNQSGFYEDNPSFLPTHNVLDPFLF
jgi:hypothetical protein